MPFLVMTPKEEKNKVIFSLILEPFLLTYLECGHLTITFVEFDNTLDFVLVGKRFSIRLFLSPQLSGKGLQLKCLDVHTRNPIMEIKMTKTATDIFSMYFFSRSFVSPLHQ